MSILQWFKPKVNAVDQGLQRDKDGFYINGGDMVNGGPEFKDFHKGLEDYRKNINNYSHNYTMSANQCITTFTHW